MDRWRDDWLPGRQPESQTVRDQSCAAGSSGGVEEVAGRSGNSFALPIGYDFFVRSLSIG